MTQAEDRCHRIGQTDSVLVQHLVLDRSLDQRMAETLVEKQTTCDKTLDAEIRSIEERTPTIPTAGSEHATRGTRHNELEATAKTLTEENITKIHGAIGALAGACDGAVELDGAGFNRIDTGMGHRLAELDRLTPRQAALAARICRRYKGQLGSPAWLDEIMKRHAARPAAPAAKAPVPKRSTC